MKTGTVVALEVDHFSNAGNTLDLSQSVSGTCCPHPGGDWVVCIRRHRPPQFSPVTVAVASQLVPPHVLHPWFISAAQRGPCY